MSHIRAYAPHRFAYSTATAPSRDARARQTRTHARTYARTRWARPGRVSVLAAPGKSRRVLVVRKSTGGPARPDPYNIVWDLRAGMIFSYTARRTPRDGGDGGDKNWGSSRRRSHHRQKPAPVGLKTRSSGAGSDDGR